MSLATGPVDSALQSLLDRLENISGQFQELRDGVQQVIVIADASPEMALTRARKVLEYVIRDVYERRINEPPGTRPLENLLQRLVKDGFFPDRLDAYATTIRKLGNVGTHGFGEKVELADVYQSLAQLMPILEWYFEFERPEALDTPAASSQRPRSVERKTAPQPPNRDTHASVVPKGLRSFDAQDADFFIDLMPGARDKDGLPESIRFWKHRIEATDESTFMVAVLYGPSGCGKSSLVKAGLLPKLDRQIVTVYVEATADGTEGKMLKGLQARCPALGSNLELVEAIKLLRSTVGTKIVIVLDQFEQWLHAHRNQQGTELAQALRQCDGQHVQCLILVRDDFWMALGRFMAEVQIELVQGQNMAAVDLFDFLHARSVLEMFGRAFGRINKDATDGQKSFLDQAIRGLDRDGRVIPVHLALFADMIQGKPWLPATLREVGGTGGIGVSFLEETFSATSAAAERRYHERAARSVLNTLLPEAGADIKGHMHSYAELLQVSGYGNHPSKFNDLIRILDGELRLITPTDPEGKNDAGALGRPAEPQQRYYQLTHDYLVGSLREWLNRKQKETRRGRAALRLAERSAAWAARPEKRQLPSLFEWLSIRWLTQRRSWTQSQSRMMREAARHHAIRALVAMCVVAVLIVGGREVSGRIEANSLVERLVSADIQQVPDIVRKLAAYDRWASPILSAKEKQAQTGSPQQLHLQLALMATDEGGVQDLGKRLLEATPNQFPVVCTMLGPKQAVLIEPLWTTALDESLPAAKRFHAACALASYAPDDPRWRKVDALVATQLVSRHASEYLVWRDALRTAKQQLLQPLAAIYRDKDQSEQARTYAAETLADYASDNPATLTDLLADAQQFQYQTLYDPVVRHQQEGIRLAQRELAKTAGDEATQEAKEHLAQRQANLAVALYRMGQTEAIWPLLKHSPDPRVRSYIIHWLGARQAESGQVAQRLEIEADVSTRRALILSLAEFPETGSAVQRAAHVERLQQIYVRATDPGERAAAEWVLRQWGQTDWLRQLNIQNAQMQLRDKRLSKIAREMRDQKEKIGPRWFVNSQAQTMVVIPGPAEFAMGAPPSEAGRFDDEPQHAKRISRTFAIAATPVTVEQYRKFDSKYDYTPRYAPAPDCPAISITWYDAARYCNWLSKEDGLSSKDCCYETNAKGEITQLKKNYLSLTGYRLPTEAECEYAARAGAITSRYYGETETLLAEYGWYLRNSDEHSWPVGSKKPNDFGLFDMHGNIWCWCQERYIPYRQAESDKPSDDVEDKLTIDNAENRVLHGGAYNALAPYLRSANRHDYAPTYHVNSAGFRVARTIRAE